MDAATVNATLKRHIKDMQDRLEQAAAIAKAAQACAEAGKIEKAIEIALDVERVLYEVTSFLNAAGMIHLMRKQT